MKTGEVRARRQAVHAREVGRATSGHVRYPGQHGARVRNTGRGTEAYLFCCSCALRFFALRSCSLHSSSDLRSTNRRCVAASAIFQFSYVRESM